MSSSRDRDGFKPSRDRRERSRSRDRSKLSRSRERNRNDGGDRNYRTERNFGGRRDDDRTTNRYDRDQQTTNAVGGGFVPGGGDRDKRKFSPRRGGFGDGSDTKRPRSDRNENQGREDKRDNERFTRTRSGDGDRELWNRSRNPAHDFDGNTNSYDDQKGQPRFSRDNGNNRRFGNSGTFGQRGSAFGRRVFNRGRGGRGGVYRPGEEDDKPKLNLFDPRDVPKGRSYFDHDDRAAGGMMGRGRGRGRGNFGPRFNRNNYNSQESSGGDFWSHDMFQNEGEQQINEEQS